MAFVCAGDAEREEERRVGSLPMELVSLIGDCTLEKLLTASSGKFGKIVDASDVVRL